MRTAQSRTSTVSVGWSVSSPKSSGAIPQNVEPAGAQPLFTAAFALARDLKGATEPFPGVIVILLERPQDAWLAEWSGADAWFVKPVNPFELVDTITASTSRIREEAV